MATTFWEFDTPDGTHTVSVSWEFPTGRRIIQLDGKKIVDQTLWIDRGSRHTFHCGRQTCVLFIDVFGAWPSFSLSVDGNAIPQMPTGSADGLLIPTSAPTPSGDSLVRPAGPTSGDTGSERLVRPIELPDSGE
jgi:hypothetical protein